MRAIGDADARGDAVALFDALVAQGSPVVLVVDDVGGLASGDLGALVALVKRLRPEGPVLLLLLAGEGDEGDVLGPGVCELVLGPLDEEAVRAWANDLGVADAAWAVMRRSGGHPADVAEILARNAAPATRELGMPRATFYRKLERYGIQRPAASPTRPS